MMLHKIRKVICSLIGHNYINLYRETWNADNWRDFSSTTTGWECQRCGHQKSAQWDN